jgi:hypothetical protein
MRDERLAAAHGMLWGIAVSAVLWGTIIGTLYVFSHGSPDPTTIAMRALK